MSHTYRSKRGLEVTHVDFTDTTPTGPMPLPGEPNLNPPPNIEIKIYPHDPIPEVLLDDPFGKWISRMVWIALIGAILGLMFWPR